MVTLPVTLEVTLPGCCRDREGGLVRQVTPTNEDSHA